MSLLARLTQFIRKKLYLLKAKSSKIRPSHFADKRILIIEDDPETQEATQKVLDRRGFKTFCASDGQEGLDLLKTEPADLILLDSRLPDIEGPEVCKNIKNNEKTKDIPVIFLTVVSSSENIIDSFDCGADNYLVKPIAPSELIFQIEKILLKHEP